MNVEMCCSGNDNGSRPLVAVLDSVQIWVGGGAVLDSVLQ